MWAQDFSNLSPKGITVPYPEVNPSDVTREMIRQNYTVEKMFKMAEHFFTSIGFYKMTPEFWKYSMLEKPANRNVSCHGSAYDLHNGKDYRIKMCTEINHDSFFTVHHEMGHIEYYMAYAHQPDVYRRGANSAFHEAIGDLISLSVNTAKHMKVIGLLDDANVTQQVREKQDINFLMNQALRIVAFLPFGYLMDKWRWGVFDGNITDDVYNKKWWQMRLKYQGLVPPVKRSEKDFDPGAKYHIPSNVPYLRYFISHVIQFQFYAAMCDGIHQGPLYGCDFYKSKSAGDKLKRMLSLGKSKPWPEALGVLIGHKSLTTKPMMDYFKPLFDWLKKENGNETCDWIKAGETVESVIDKYFV